MEKKWVIRIIYTINPKDERDPTTNAVITINRGSEIYQAGYQTEALYK